MAMSATLMATPSLIAMGLMPEGGWLAMLRLADTHFQLFQRVAE